MRYAHPILLLLAFILGMMASVTLATEEQPEAAEANSVVVTAEQLPGSNQSDESDESSSKLSSNSQLTNSVISPKPTNRPSRQEELAN